MNGIALEIRKASLPMFRALFFAFTILWCAGFAMAVIDRAQQIPESLYSEMKWRMIGPFRAGRVNAVAGVPGDPGVYYFGASGGGVVRKTTDGGTVWKPIFDEEPVASIGALVLAPSNPNIIYVGSGENNPNVEHMRPFAQDDHGRGLALRAGPFVVRKPGEEDHHRSGSIAAGRRKMTRLLYLWRLLELRQIRQDLGAVLFGVHVKIGLANDAMGIDEKGMTRGKFGDS